MAKRPLVQCRICKGKIDRDGQKDWCMPQEKWYYHIACYDDFAKKRGAIKEGDIHIEVDDDMWKGAVYDYLKRDLKISLDFRKFTSQWNNLLKTGKTAKGIYFTLRYFYEIEKGDVSKSENGIGIVFKTYEKGTCYWGERNLRDKGICARIEAQIMQAAEQKVHIIRQAPKVVKKPTIDLAAIADMEDEDD
jgi:hypothetical protein